MKHVGALVAITVLVFGTIFLLTSDWPFGGPAEEAVSAGEAAMPAAENPAPEGADSPAQEAAAEPEPEAVAEAEQPEAVAETEAPEAAPAEEAPAEQAPAAEEAAPEAEDAGGDEAATAPEQTETAAAGELAPMEPVSEEPEPVEAETAEAAEPADEATPEEAGGEADVAALMEAGQGTYEQICQACHGAEGEGAVGPAFADNANLEDAEYVAATIIHGQGAMPPFGDQLDDEQIAAVATFIRNSWGNEFGPVTADEVAAER